MSLKTLKQQIIAIVGTLEDEALLQDVLDILSDEKLSEKEDYYRIRLEESIRQADAGKVIPAEEVHQKIRLQISTYKTL